MAEQTKPAAEAGGTAVEKKPRKKTLWPTNCTQSNKRIRRKDWYYRDGKYFANKQCYKLYLEQESAKKAKDEAAKAEAASKAAAQAPEAG